jgi:hypothetical protein
MEQSLLLNLTSTGLADDTTSRLRQEYQAYQRFFQAQPLLVQQKLQTQAALVVEALIQGTSHLRFLLPDIVASAPLPGGRWGEESVPVTSREQSLGGRIALLVRTDLVTALRQRFTELEQSSNRAISASSGLLRYAIAIYMVYTRLPAGKSVVYRNVEGDDIPNQPVEPNLAFPPTRSTLGDENQPGADQAELVVPYVESARRFYLPQWVAFDDHGKLLVGTVSEAEAHIASMQGYLAILNSAVTIAPYMVTDETWQQKHYGMLGQLVNQGRALAHYYLDQIIQTIDRRVTEHRLDRGLSLSLPYFNDQTLKIENDNFQVIPAGRVMFIPAFVVLAVRAEAVKVAQDTSLSQSTRRHLLVALSTLEERYLR